MIVNGGVSAKPASRHNNVLTSPDFLGDFVAVTVINVMAESLVAPRIIGQGLSISPLVVFLAFFFWSRVLGPAGMLLAMPLTVLVLFILQSFEETRWLAALMQPASIVPADVQNDSTGEGGEHATHKTRSLK